VPRQSSHGFGQPALPLRLCTGSTLLPHEIHVETCRRSSQVPPNQVATKPTTPPRQPPPLPHPDPPKTTPHQAHQTTHPKTTHQTHPTTTTQTLPTQPPLNQSWLVPNLLHTVTSSGGSLCRRERGNGLAPFASGQRTRPRYGGCGDELLDVVKGEYKLHERHDDGSRAACEP